MRIAGLLGLDPTQWRHLRHLRTYRQNRAEFLRQHKTSPGEFELGLPYPVLKDYTAPSGTASGHYFHQDLLVASKIFLGNPQRHIDVGSRVDGFVAHVASFREIEVMDIRPLPSSVHNISFLQRDLSMFDAAWDNSCDSLSCLHALEHFGLGRYGDKLDYQGHLVGWKHLLRMLAPGGILYFSVPIGKRQRIEFDAHRVFSLPYIFDRMIEGQLELVDFSMVDDAGDLHTDIGLADASRSDTFGLQYGCGIFELRKPASLEV